MGRLLQEECCSLILSNTVDHLLFGRDLIPREFARYVIREFKHLPFISTQSKKQIKIMYGQKKKNVSQKIYMYRIWISYMYSVSLFPMAVHSLNDADKVRFYCK
jgi:hypothetical protein